MEPSLSLGGYKVSSGQLATFLGLFSIGLGALEVAAPKWTARQAGMGRRRVGLVRACGAREIATGVKILANPKAAPDALWARVAGDAMDLALLGKAFTDRRARPKRLMVSTAAVAGITALDVMAAVAQSASSVKADNGVVKVTERIAMNKSPEEIYEFWRPLELLPRVMNHLESVRVIDDRRSRWRAKPIAGKSFEWTAEIVEDQPGKKIAWRSVEGSEIHTAGAVTFEALPTGHGTAVTVNMEFGFTGARLLGPVKVLAETVTQHEVKRDLRRVKQLIETGEVPTTEGQPAGRRQSTTWLDTAARA